MKLIVSTSLGVLAIGIATVASQLWRSKSTATQLSVPNRTSNTPHTLAELLALTPEQIAKCDVARMNLLCAEGLRGSQGLDVEATVARLDTWAYHVEAEIKRNYHRFQSNPQDYENSEAYYRMIMLATVLQQDFGTQYSPDRAAPQLRGEWEPSDKFYGDSKDVFIHGLIGGQHFGTCSSLPVLYLAVAQRLGYPVNLASAQAHLYVRYEDGDQHLNVEAAMTGFSTYSDDHYREWPRPISDEEAKAYGLLRPKTKREILGVFLTIRAGCLTSMKQFDEAAEAWTQAARYLPPTPVLAKLVERARQRATNERDSDQWDKLWEEVGSLAIPQGDQFAYFTDKRVQLQMHMNQSTDIAAIEQGVHAFKQELAAHWKASGLNPDFVLLSTPPDLSVPTMTSSPPLLDVDALLALNSLLPHVTIPAERVPSEYRESIPPELQERLHGLVNAEHIISEMWTFQVEELNKHHRQAMESQASRQPLPPQFRAEWLPPEYRQSMPADLRSQVAYLQDRDQVRRAISAYQTSQEAARAVERMNKANQQILSFGAQPVQIQIIPTKQRDQ